MGYITIRTEGSFPSRRMQFNANNYGHARAVADAIKWLSEEVLPEAIERDHKLHAEGKQPLKGFNRDGR